MDRQKRVLIDAAKKALEVLDFTLMDCAADDKGRMIPAANALRGAIDFVAEGRSEEQEQYLAAAKAAWASDGECEFDDDAVVSLSEDTDYPSGHCGAYVQAWVFVATVEEQVER